MQQTSVTTDFLVIGGGVIGVNIAWALKKRYPTSTVTLIEKESLCGTHASGRNSGVIHAGFYYSADSLKAKFTREGNVRITTYCEEKQIPLNRCGKLVVAKEAAELTALDELMKRGEANGVKLFALSERDAKEIEPRVKTYERALFSPTTSTVDPTAVLQAMVTDAVSEGVQIESGVAFVKKTGRRVQTTKCQYEAGYVVNAAGLYADKIAKQFGFSDRYRILPFKGLYLYSDEPSGALRTNIYPVPDFRNPFLGVHFTVTNEGKVKIGPTAIPALWREQYNGLSRFSLSEFLEIAGRGLSLLSNAGFEFRRLAIDEVLKYSRRRMVNLASELVEGLRLEHYSKWGAPGIRAQLLDVRKRRLEMDFVLEGDEHSMHVLNAVSPAFTCALPFSEYVCQRIERVVH
jgi:L-2-hydroxyglutarate oxidase LhgO